MLIGVSRVYTHFSVLFIVFLRWDFESSREFSITSISQTFAYSFDALGKGWLFAYSLESNALLSCDAPILYLIIYEFTWL